MSHSYIHRDFALLAAPAFRPMIHFLVTSVGALPSYSFDDQQISIIWPVIILINSSMTMIAGSDSYCLRLESYAVLSEERPRPLLAASLK